MKNLLYLAMLFFSASLINEQIFAETLNRNNNRLCCPNKKQCKTFINITAHDINQASQDSAQGLVLDKPNTNYKLCENVNWTTSRPNSFAITIAADNVTLDLNGHTIKQQDITQAASFAINVLGTTNFTIIQNGTLQQISGGGILVNAGAHCLTIDAITCNQCCYNGQTAVVPPLPGLDNAASALLFNGSPDALIEDVIITNCRFCDNGIIGTAPVWFTGTVSNSTTLTLTEPPLYPVTPGFILSSGGTILGTIVSQESPTTFTISPTSDIGPVAMTVTDPNGAFIPFGNVSFMYVAFASNITVENCIGSGNFGYFFSFALFFVKSEFINISNVKINSPTTFVLCKGMEFAGCNNVIAQDIDITNLTMNFTPDADNFAIGHGAEGIKCGSSFDCIFRRINFSRSRVQTQVPTALTAPTAYVDCCGIFYDVLSGLGPIRNIVVEDCTAVDMRSDGGKVASNVSYTAGFNNSSAILFGTIQEEMNNLRYEGCSASGIFAEVGWAYGFGSSPEPNFIAIENDISYVNCMAEDITITGSGIFAAGYILTAERNIIRDCSANRILDERPNPAAYGVLLDNLGDGNQARACIIAENTITNCSTTGILDISTLNNNIVNSNYAALNGFLGAGPNYVGLAPSSAALIQDWPLNGVPAAPPVGGPVLANVSVHN
ncbi:MAG: hypothetical protein AB7F19_01590 [Candidatus Babeliales bacterium]